jgi:hypothetical protein
MTDHQRRSEDEDAENETTDIGEGGRGIASPSRGGTFAQTPGEGGDKAEEPMRGPDTTPPHRQEQS